MCLSPDHSWYWYFDQSKHKLALALGDEYLFVSAFQEKQLIPDSFYQQPFTAGQAELFYHLLEQLPKQLTVTNAELFQLAFNLIAARDLVLPMMPKSWFFNSSATIVYPKVAKVVSLENQFQRARFIIVEATEQTSLLMLLDEQCQLNEQKTLEQFSLIKVMNDRLMPAMANSNVRIIAA